MSIGKTAAAAAHASLGVFFDILKKDDKTYLQSRDPIFPSDLSTMTKYEFYVTKDVTEWIDGIFTKICLVIKDESIFDELIELAKQVNILYKLIEDAGSTEVEPGSKTALAIGPLDTERSLYSKLIGRLKSLPLLK